MFEEKMKKIDVWDVSLIKLGSVLFILFLITAWPAFANLIFDVNWKWFLGAAILVLLRPGYRFWFK
tara:strand:+ start:12349 stop:12546 length:198 start_codon:yes stop_codon:yes gene_type:complete